MEATRNAPLQFDNSFVRDLDGMYERWSADGATAPRLLLLNRPLADELGIDPEWLTSPEGVALLVGTTLPDGSVPVAQAYAGHQFGGLSPRLGDGRAVLLGELVDVHGRRRDLHLKGTGRTPFARGGDGKAAVGPMVREYVMGEAMHALGIPTTRALAVVATGDPVARETLLPGAVLARVASSHLRVGSFQYAALQEEPGLVRRLADYAIARHYPQVADAPNPYLSFLEAVVGAQAELVARWMAVGFIHGVMNTDNTTISGETIDYGPCAFMDAFDPATVFSSIDHQGRYAYGNQPSIAQWNLARLAETLLPLIDGDAARSIELATEVVNGFVGRFNDVWARLMRAKLGLAEGHERGSLVDDLLAMLQAERVDHTLFFRRLSAAVLGDSGPVRSLFAAPEAFDDWVDGWGTAVADGRDATVVAAAMDAVNPVYVARNHLVEEALAAASAGDDLGPVRQLLDVLSQPFTEREGFERYTQPAPPSWEGYQTFCGT